MVGGLCSFLNVVPSGESVLQNREEQDQHFPGLHTSVDTAQDDSHCDGLNNGPWRDPNT